MSTFTDPVVAIRTIFEDAIAAHRRFAGDGLHSVAAAAAAIISALSSGRKVLLFGNGGSAADAQHLAAELVGRFEKERPPLAALALTADSSVMTAISNDYGYEYVFARQIEALGQAGDVAFGISTSGRSRNVEAALAAARSRGLTTIVLTGGGGRLRGEADIHLAVPEQCAPRVQEVHRTILHAICSIIDQADINIAP
jgi:D-sedoheptulose 7-phosphate isomerase